jgi:hypothetical protein
MAQVDSLPQDVYCPLEQTYLSQSGSQCVYEQMKARKSRIPVPERTRLREAAERVIRLYEACGNLDQATAWKAKLGMPDLPTEVFARPGGQIR